MPFIETVPFIRAARGGAAEMVAKALDARLREHLSNSRNNLFTDGDDNILNDQRRPGMYNLLIFSHKGNHCEIFINVFDTIYSFNIARS